MPALFSVGDYVRRKSAPDQGGVIRNARFAEQRETWVYTVQFGNRQLALVEADLELPKQPDERSDLANGQLASWKALRTAFTYHRLRRPPARVAASFGTSRTLFYPYQFKPLLKLLEHPRRRVLVADDVGLGKTIEAGYILRELDAHTPLERVLIVCPARLVPKWQADLKDKFGETFEPATSRQLMTLAEQVRQSTDQLPRFRWITSYEAARRPGFVRFMENQPPQLDLVVMDEAHRVRNPDTQQHQLAAALCEAAEAAVFLTATPVQTRMDDLFHLLALLDPTTFTDVTSFRTQIEANRHIARALTFLRTQPVQAEAALAELEQLAEYDHARHMVQSPLFAATIEQIRQAASLSRSQLVTVQRDLSEFGLTANILSRTRRVDVRENRAMRMVQAISVQMTPAETAYYLRVQQLCEEAADAGAGWGTSLAAITAYRMAASCLPASVSYFAEHVGGEDVGAELREGLLDEVTDVAGDAQDHDESAQGLPELHEGLRKLASGSALRNADSKYRFLKDALQVIWHEDAQANRPRRKIILFSFFKRTLGNLQAWMRADNIGTTLISGDVPILTREQRIAAFRHDPSIEVLLASEVGAEGIDLQFASVVVNYDLPWNPMVVEQRIGRVDRIGQLSPTITVLNFTMKDTIEERVLLRLYQRVKLFEGMVGEIEPIVGEQVFQLARHALTGRLTPEQEELQVEQTARAMVNQLLTAQDLNQNVDAMLATDQAFLDEVEANVGRRRLPSPTEMHTFVQSALEAKFHGCYIPPQAIVDRAKPQLLRDVAAELRALPGADNSEAQRMARLIEAGEFELTFAADKALGMRNVELVHARHPLVALAQHLTDKHLGGNQFCYAVAAPKPGPAEQWAESEIAAGYYLLSLSLHEFNGAVRRNDLSVAVLPLGALDPEQAVVGDTARELLMWVIDRGRELTAIIPQETRDLAVEASDLLDEVRNREYEREYAREDRVNQIRAERKYTTLKASLDVRVQIATEQRDRAVKLAQGAFHRRMCDAKLTKALNRRQAELEALAPGQKLEMQTEHLATVLIQLTEE